MSDDAKLLVVDDDTMMLDFAVRCLSSLGYSCAVATDAASALRLLEQDPQIRILFTDMRLGEGPSGLELAQDALATWPDLGVLLTSGASGLLNDADEVLPQSVEILAKPYRRRELAERLTRILETRSGRT